MSMGGHLVTVLGHESPDPVWCEEYGYGLGLPDGIMVLKYRAARWLEFGETRQDFLHQLYWSPDGMLSTMNDGTARFIGPGEAFWAERTISHDVHATEGQLVYRVCLREVPVGLTGVHVGAIAIDESAQRLLEEISRPAQPEPQALAARHRILAGLTSAGASPPATTASGGRGAAREVARELSHHPGDRRTLDDWAACLHISSKTLQRDFQREYGMPFSRWRTRLRLDAARVLLHSHPVSVVARRCGYSSPSAFIVAFTQQFDCTPGEIKRRPGAASIH